MDTDRATKVQQAMESNRPPAEIYRFWRALENLPRVMTHLESVQVLDDRVSHWVMKLIPGAPRVESDAEIINEVENQRIGWRSLHESDLDHAGSVEFKPIGDGQRTGLTVTLQYELPGGTLGGTIGKWFGGDPSNTLAADLQRFKEHMEAGILSMPDNHALI
ncbi:MAG: SRPBCC family protein [Nitrospira sp.]